MCIAGVIVPYVVHFVFLTLFTMFLFHCFFFFQAEDGIRDLVRSRGLGDVYKRQFPTGDLPDERIDRVGRRRAVDLGGGRGPFRGMPGLSLIHI